MQASGFIQILDARRYLAPMGIRLLAGAREQIAKRAHVAVPQDPVLLHVGARHSITWSCRRLAQAHMGFTLAAVLRS